MSAINPSSFSSGTLRDSEIVSMYVVSVSKTTVCLVMSEEVIGALLITFSPNLDYVDLNSKK